MTILIATGAAVFFLIVLNISYCCYFKRIKKEDKGFEYWTLSYKKTTCVITILGVIFSFKINRLFYSRFYGMDKFNAAFDNA